MTEVPADVVDGNTIVEWEAAKAALAKAQAREILLRQRIFKAYFPTPKEGVNNYDLGSGITLKGDYKINRTLDDAAFDTSKAMFKEQGIPVDDVVKAKPTLVVKEFKLLTDEQHAIFDVVVTIKPGTPALEINRPKAK